MTQNPEAKCPVHHAVGRGTVNQHWWPNQLRVDLLHQHSSKSDPMGKDFNYAKEFKSLDYEDARATVTTVSAAA